MIIAAAVVPHPPLLVRELTGRTDPVADLREVCVDAVATALAGATTAVVLAAEDESRSWDPASSADLHAFAPALSPGSGSLPLSLEVGKRLVSESRATAALELRSFARGRPVEDLGQSLVHHAGAVGLVLMADGTSRRDENAPELDAEAAALDREVSRALAEGDHQALLALDLDHAQAHGMTGAPAYRLLGALGEALPPTRATLRLTTDSYGVGYHVALWQWTA